MNIELKDVFTFLGSVSIGAILLDWLRIKFEKRKKENEKRHELMEVRYQAVINLMIAAMDFEKHKSWLQDPNRRSDLKNINDLVDYLDQEWKNMMLYANDNVVRNMREFVKNQTQENFWKTVIAMRKELYGIQTKLSLEDFVEKAVDK